MDLKEKIAREVENAKYANHNCTGVSERILSLFSDSENLPIDFIKWYSGMDKEKIGCAPSLVVSTNPKDSAVQLMQLYRELLHREKIKLSFQL